MFLRFFFFGFCVVGLIRYFNEISGSRLVSPIIFRYENAALYMSGGYLSFLLFLFPLLFFLLTYVLSYLFDHHFFLRLGFVGLVQN